MLEIAYNDSMSSDQEKPLDALHEAQVMFFAQRELMASKARAPVNEKIETLRSTMEGLLTDKGGKKERFGEYVANRADQESIAELSTYAERYRGDLAEKCHDIRQRLTSGEQPAEIPGFFAEGTQGAVFRVGEYLAKFPKEQGNRLDVLDTHQLFRARGIEGSPQLVAFSNEDACTVMTIVPGKDLRSIDPTELHYRDDQLRSLVDTLSGLQERGFSIDAAPGNILHDEQAGFGIIDYIENPTPYHSHVVLPMLLAQHDFPMVQDEKDNGPEYAVQFFGRHIRLFQVWMSYLSLLKQERSDEFKGVATMLNTFLAERTEIKTDVTNYCWFVDTQAPLLPVDSENLKDEADALLQSIEDICQQE